MGYFKPYIDEAGLHTPTYIDIRDELVKQARFVFGENIYLENDSQDYQLISVIADMIHDTTMLLELVYNNRSPSTAIGGALDGLVKLNGIRRKEATKSRCYVALEGEPNTRIVNGVIADENNINWDLESPIVISENGKVETLAVCQLLGAIHVGIGNLNKIVTPTKGWVSVINNQPSITGQNVESQEELRARQSISTAKPSLTILEGLIGGIAELEGVTRYRVYENDTNITDSNTIPGHSICAVVEGGKDTQIATEIHLRKTPGCGTYGDIVVEIETGFIHGKQRVTPISLFRPQYVDIHVTITIKRLPGYVTQITEDIKENIAEYLNSLQIGEDLTISALWSIGLMATPNLTVPFFSITSVTTGRDEENQQNVDMEIPFNAVTRGIKNNVIVNFI